MSASKESRRRPEQIAAVAAFLGAQAEALLRQYLDLEEKRQELIAAEKKRRDAIGKPADDEYYEEWAYAQVADEFDDPFGFLNWIEGFNDDGRLRELYTRLAGNDDAAQR